MLAAREVSRASSIEQVMRLRVRTVKQLRRAWMAHLDAAPGLKPQHLRQGKNAVQVLICTAWRVQPR